MKEQRQSSAEEDHSPFSNLPEEMILEILLRLPVRSLLRFKSVCKLWLSLISDPKFGKSHFDLAAAPTYRCLTKSHNDSEIESIEVDASPHDESCVLNLKFPLPPPRNEHGVFDRDPPSDVMFLGSCRGFVLVAYPKGDVIVWNPSTGVQRRIADHLHEIIALSPIGFGYDASTDDYFLVIMEVIPLTTLEFDPDTAAADFPTRIHLFSMKTNSWFYPEGTYAQYVDLGFYDLRIGSFLNGALHWLVTSYETKLHVIIAFDLVERSLSEIPLSQSLAQELDSESKQHGYYLRVIGECLSLCYPGDAASTAEIWMMKDYKVQSSWTKLFVVSTCNIPRDILFPICFTKHGEIFCSYGFGKLVILNDKGWLLLDHSTLWPKPHMLFDTERESMLHCGLYRESLLSLPDDSVQASEEGQLTSSLEEASEDGQE